MKYFNDDNINVEQDKWIDIAFPVTIIAISFGLIFPGLIIQLLGKLNWPLGDFSKVSIRVIATQILFILPLFFVAILKDKNISLRKKLGFINWDNKYYLEVLCYELILFLPLWVIAATFFLIFDYFGYKTTSPVAELLLSVSTRGRLLFFILSVALAPIIEELVFRRVVFTFLKKFIGITPAILIASLIFGALHGGLVQLIPLTILGIVLQILYLKHNSIYPSIMLHSLHNFIVMSIFLSLGV